MTNIKQKVAQASSDFAIVQRGVVGKGDGEDHYVLSTRWLQGDNQITLSDTQHNLIYLTDGLEVASALLAPNALQLTTNNATEITILDANEYSYVISDPFESDLEGDIGAVNLNYNELLQTLFGTSAPTSGVVEAGPIILGTALPQNAKQNIGTLEDAVAVQRGVIGKGGGSDVYFIAQNIIEAGAKITITDQGHNTLHFLDGLEIKSSLVAENALLLTLENDAEITILDANNFQYQVGGSPLTDSDGSLLNYSEYVRDVLGIDIPLSGEISTGGSVLVNQTRLQDDKGIINNVTGPVTLQDKSTFKVSNVNSGAKIEAKFTAPVDAASVELAANSNVVLETQNVKELVIKTTGEESTLSSLSGENLSKVVVEGDKDIRISKFGTSDNPNLQLDASQLQGDLDLTLSSRGSGEIISGSGNDKVVILGNYNEKSYSDNPEVNSLANKSSSNPGSGTGLHILEGEINLGSGEDTLELYGAIEVGNFSMSGVERVEINSYFSTYSYFLKQWEDVEVVFTGSEDHILKIKIVKDPVTGDYVTDFDLSMITVAQGNLFVEVYCDDPLFLPDDFIQDITRDINLLNGAELYLSDHTRSSSEFERVIEGILYASEGEQVLYIPENAPVWTRYDVAYDATSIFEQFENFARGDFYSSAIINTVTGQQESVTHGLISAGSTDWDVGNTEQIVQFNTGQLLASALAKSPNSLEPESAHYYADQVSKTFPFQIKVPSAELKYGEYINFGEVSQSWGVDFNYQLQVQSKLDYETLPTMQIPIYFLGVHLNANDQAERVLATLFGDQVYTYYSPIGESFGERSVFLSSSAKPFITNDIINIVVINVDEVAPRITSGDTVFLDMAPLAGDVIYTAIATDDEDISEGVTFQLIEGSAIFNIDSESGEVAFRGSVEAGEYSFTVIALDTEENTTDINGDPTSQHIKEVTVTVENPYVIVSLVDGEATVGRDVLEIFQVNLSEGGQFEVQGFSAGEDQLSLIAPFVDDQLTNLNDYIGNLGFGGEEIVAQYNPFSDETIINFGFGSDGELVTLVMGGLSQEALSSIEII